MRDKLMFTAAAVALLSQGLTLPLAAQSAGQYTRPAPVPEPTPSRPYLTNRAADTNAAWNGATFRCESRDGRRNTCSADTRGGIRLLKQLSDVQCREGRTWGISSNAIWVDGGCRGEFQQRYGGVGSVVGSSGNGNSSSSGPSTAAIIGGVAVAGGLIALLAKPGKGGKPAPTTAIGQPAGPQQPPLPAPPAGPAKISAQMGSVSPDARPALSMCLNDAARQIGATGGSEIRLDRIDDVQPGNGGYRFRVQLGAIYPDQTRNIPAFCRATPTQVVELTFG